MVLGIYGARGLGREILDLALEVNKPDKRFDEVLFVDDDGELKSYPAINGAKIYTFDEFKADFPADTAKMVIAVGEPVVRQKLREKIAASGYSLQTLIHHTAFIGTGAQIGYGAIVQFGGFVSCNTTIGANVLLQPYVCIGHDSIIGSDSVISTYSSISGACKIGERSYIGVSTPVKENTTIGSDAIIGMGSVVVRDIPDNVIALGNPARVMKNNEDGRVFK